MRVSEIVTLLLLLFLHCVYSRAAEVIPNKPPEGGLGWLKSISQGASTVASGLKTGASSIVQSASLVPDAAKVVASKITLENAKMIVTNPGLQTAFTLLAPGPVSAAFFITKGILTISDKAKEGSAKEKKLGKNSAKEKKLGKGTPAFDLELWEADSTESKTLEKTSTERNIVAKATAASKICGVNESNGENYSEDGILISRVEVLSETTERNGLEKIEIPEDKVSNISANPGTEVKENGYSPQSKDT